MLEKIIELIYPSKCGICGKLNKEHLCKKCYKILENEAIWEFVQNKNPYIYFNEQISIFKYGNINREYILDYKFNEKSYLYKTFVNFLLNNEKVFEKIKSYDKIIPVPISKKRQKERGYNQSLLLAKQIGKNANKEVVENCLVKVKNTIEQSKLNREEREKNAQNVYKVLKQHNIKDKKVLLIDDIYTTGNTVNECCKMLKNASPAKIGVLVLAKD